MTFDARSLLAMADEMYLGLPWAEENGLLVKYPEQVVRDGEWQATGWTVKEMLRDWFSGNAATWKGGGGSIGPQWRNRLRLGSLSVLGRSFNEITLGPQEFRGQTLRGALDRVLGMIGMVSIRERFLGVDTLLDFLQLADDGAPRRRVIVARPGQPITGTNVAQIEHAVSSDNVKTRMIAVGDRRRFSVSVRTDHPTAPLERLWDPAHEAAVLAFPQGQVPVGGTELKPWVAPQAHVFRRYRLPACIRRLEVGRELEFVLADGSRATMQVWKMPRTRVWNEGLQEWTSTPGTQPELIEGWEFDAEQGVIVLRDPAVNLSGATQAITLGPSGSQYSWNQTWVEAPVGVTLSVGGRRLYHDTGVQANGMSLEGIAGDGVVETFEVESFGFHQATNIGEPFADDSGDTHEYDEAWFYNTAAVGGPAWEYYDAATVLRDQTLDFVEHVQNALREKNDVRQNYTIRLPWFSSGYRLGEMIEVVGQDDFEMGTHQILTLVWDLTNNHSTTITTDNSRPLISSSVLGG